MPAIVGFIVAIIVGVMLIDFVVAAMNIFDSILDSILRLVGAVIEFGLLIIGLVFIAFAFSSGVNGKEKIYSIIIGVVLIGLYFLDLYGTIAEIIFFLITAFLILLVFVLVFKATEDVAVPARFMAASTASAIFVFVLFEIMPLLAYVPIFSVEVKVLSRIESATASVASRIIPGLERRIFSSEAKIASNAVKSAEREAAATAESAAKRGVIAAETAEGEGAALERKGERRAETAGRARSGGGKAGAEAEKAGESAGKKVREKADMGTSMVQTPMKVEHMTTIREDLVGKVHPETGVKYSSRKIVTPEGKRVEGVFPVFPSVYEVDLPLEMYKATDAVQFNACNKTLQEAISDNPALRSKFNKKQLEQIMNGDRPSGFTWHHNETEGLMQLVPSDIHSKTPHTGGRSIWGGGSENR